MEPAEGKDLESFTAGDGSLSHGAQPEYQLLFRHAVHMSQFTALGFQLQTQTLQNPLPTVLRISQQNSILLDQTGWSFLALSEAKMT